MKESSTTTKIHAVFDASPKSSSGVSLNDQLLVGPTVHPTLVDVLLRFRLHRIALTSDVSPMYQAVLPPLVIVTYTGLFGESNLMKSCVTNE